MPPPLGLQRPSQARLPRYLAELAALVNIDCGSYTPAGVNRVADVVAASLAELGATVERIPHAPDPASRSSATWSSAAWPATGRGSC